MQINTIISPVRKCGTRKEGVYLVGGTEGSIDGVLERFTLLHPPVPYNVPVHRNYRLVDADAILNRQPMNEWWIDASQKTEEVKAGNAWAIKVFGMTTSRRLEIGECREATSPEDAIAILTSKITWSNRLIGLFRNLTLNGVQGITKAAVAYNHLHESMLRYTLDQKIGTLMGIQASVWQIAYALPPTRRSDIVPDLTRMLAVMGLMNDAAALQKTFNGYHKEQ